MHRRTILLGGLAASLGTSLHASRARADDRPLKIGVLNDMSGVFADYQGPGSLLATQMAVEDAGGKAGSRAIEVVSADHQNKPDTGMAIARRWLDQDGVDVVMDVPNSAIALAVAQFVTERNRCSSASAPAQPNSPARAARPTSSSGTTTRGRPARRWAARSPSGGGKTWFTLAADYAFGAELDRNITARR